MTAPTAAGQGGPAVPHPRETAALEGHGRAEATLRRAWDSGRLPHAWLITGARGIGKATLAYRFAKFVLGGPANPGADMFGEPATDLDAPADAAGVRQIVAGGHPDLHVLEPGRSGILADQAAAAVHFCHMTAAASPWRIVVVDPAEEMNTTAANRLLKVLEEPPRHALLLLISHQPARLPPTIRSRCARLALPVLTDDTVRRHLAAFRPELAPDDADAIARLAEGSIGGALTLASAGGLDLYRHMLDLLGAMPNPDNAALHAFADKLAEGGEGGTFRLGGGLLAWWLGRVAHASATGRMPAPVLAGEDAVVRRLRDGVALERLLDLWDKTVRLFGDAEHRNYDRRQVVLTLFLEIQAIAR